MTYNIKQCFQNKKGFTLVELMVVIAIIGILAVVAIPKLASATDNAKKAKIMTDLRTIDSAMMVYFARKGSYPSYNGDGQAKLDANHPLVKEGYLASIPVPPSGIFNGYEIRDGAYYTEDNHVDAYAGEWRACIILNQVYYDVDHLKNNLNW